MPQRRPRFAFLLSALFGLLVVGGCGSSATLQSRTMSEAPSVDGALDDWGGTLTYLEDEPVSMSAVSTDSLLYVALSVQDPRLIRTVVTNGLMLWVDPASDQQRTYGIQYPLGLRAQRSEQQSAPLEDRADDRSALPIDQVNLSKLDVVWGDSTRRRVPAHFSSGFRAKATLDPGALIYELAIPVREAPGETSGRQYGLRTALGQTVDIGLETPEPEEEGADGRNLGTGVPSVTGRPGGRRGRRGRRRQRRQATSTVQRAEVPHLDLWATVVTANGK